MAKRVSRTTGGQPENDNAHKGARFRSAVARALARKGGTIDRGLDMLCDKLVGAAAEGEQWALQMVAERIEGKAAQTVYVGEAPEQIQGPDHDELTVRLARALIGRASSSDSSTTVQ
jgi:hypothetical protein